MLLSISSFKATVALLGAKVQRFPVRETWRRVAGAVDLSLLLRSGNKSGNLSRVAGAVDPSHLLRSGNKCGNLNNYCKGFIQKGTGALPARICLRWKRGIQQTTHETMRTPNAITRGEQIRQIWPNDLTSPAMILARFFGMDHCHRKSCDST